MNKVIRQKILVSGRVQGVGFRPAVYALAKRLGLNGWVANFNGSVEIEIEGEAHAVHHFPREMEANAPKLSIIHNIDLEVIEPLGCSEFIIRESDNSRKASVSITPDIAVCSKCIDDICNPDNRRFQYPFTSCTNCGPRFSILNELPYDRANTSMNDFDMCEHCLQEYSDPLDRRFHAQPIACPDCGPELSIYDKNGCKTITGHNALDVTAEAISQGKIIALKGLGGFQFVVDAGNTVAVQKLRSRKRRPTKPFAIMVQKLRQAEDLAELSAIEWDYLTSPEAPIVIVKRKQRVQISDEVAPGLPWLGLMMPTTPLHYLLLEKLGRPVIVTSGNPGGEPILTDNESALERLNGVCDLFLMHNRRVLHPVDDSVIRIINNKPAMLRMARGYAPKSVFTKEADKPLMAAGSYQKSTIALAGQGVVTISPHIGDLDTSASRVFYERAGSTLKTLTGTTPEEIIHDAHPDYYSTYYARETGLPCRKLLHHHAHIMSVIGEHGISKEHPVFAVVWDGTGYGANGDIWGGEFLIIEGTFCKRFGHIRHFSLPGAEQAAREPLRSALGIMYEVGGEEKVREVFENSIDQKQIELMLLAVKNSVNSPFATSAGRLFDGFAFLANICRKISYEGEAAITVEATADKCNIRSDICELPIIRTNNLYCLDWRPLFEGNTLDAYAFHRALVNGIVSMAERSEIKTVILTGGCFQNGLLTTLTTECLQDIGYQVYRNELIPANDGGISFGQAFWGVQN